MLKFILVFCLFPHISQAADLDQQCWNSDRSFYDCSSGGGAVGVSAPVVGDTLESNPANLPVQEAPFGVEVLGSDRSSPMGKPKVNFGLVKGFDGLGFGIGSWSKGTFSAPDFPQHFLGTSGSDYYRTYEKEDKSVLGLRLGTAVVMPKALFPKFLRVSVGGSVGFGQVRGDYSPQVGLVMRIFSLGVGYSENYEQLSVDLPRNRISIFSSGIFLGRVFLGYSYSTIRSSLNRTYSNSAFVRVPFAKWVAHGGLKFQKDHRGQQDHWHRAGLLRKLGKHFSLGYEYGYYRYSHSLLMQVFF